MTIKVYHHPFSRAANTVWMLEEVGVPYELEFVDIMKGAQKEAAFLAMNPMGKLPTMKDGDTIITESAAIGLYLADRYGAGKLSPALDSPDRGTYLRWSLFAPSVIEPGATAKANSVDFKPGQVGWGDYASMVKTIESAITGRDFVLGSNFSMADIIFGGTVRFMLRFKMIEATSVLSAYAERLGARPALQRAEARNEAIAKEHGLKMG